MTICSISVAVSTAFDFSSIWSSTEVVKHLFSPEETLSKGNKPFADSRQKLCATRVVGDDSQTMCSRGLDAGNVPDSRSRSWDTNKRQIWDAMVDLTKLSPVDRLREPLVVKCPPFVGLAEIQSCPGPKGRACGATSPEEERGTSSPSRCSYIRSSAPDLRHQLPSSVAEDLCLAPYADSNMRSFWKIGCHDDELRGTVEHEKASLVN